MDRRDGEILGNEAVTIKELQERRELVLRDWMAGIIPPKTAQTRIRWLTSLIERRANDERYADEVKRLFQPIRA